MTPTQKKTLAAIKQARLSGRSRTSAEAYAQMDRAMAALKAATNGNVSMTGPAKRA